MLSQSFHFKDIEHAVCSHFRIEPAQLRSVTANQKNARRRYIAVHLAREYTTLSLSALGDRLHKDHSTIISAQKRARELIEASEIFCEDLIAVREILFSQQPYKERLRRAAQDFAGNKPIPADLAATWV